MSQEQLVNSFLSFLGATKQHTSLKFLNELIKAHQEKVKWETLTKIIDWKKVIKQVIFFLPLRHTYTVFSKVRKENITLPLLNLLIG